MARLIDADELLKDNTWEWFDEWGNYTSAGQAIADAPTVDAVEVVRCKDCIYRKVNFLATASICEKVLHTIENENDFCSYGAKMDGINE